MFKILKLIHSEYKNYLGGGTRKNHIIRGILLYCKDTKFQVVVLIRMLMTLPITNYKWMRYKNRLLKNYGVDIGLGSVIGDNLRIQHYNGIVIGKGAIIGQNCTLYQQVTIGKKDGKYPVVGNDCIVYPGAKIIGGIIIGNNVTIGANAVVLHDVSDGETVVGVPAKPIKLVKSNGMFDKLPLI